MQIQNTFVAKIGPAGKRNRAARRRLERRGQGKNMCVSVVETATSPVVQAEIDSLVAELPKIPVSTPEPTVVPAVQLDFSGVWDEPIARKALALFENSGKSQRAFAAEHGFSESRLRSWKKKLTLTN
jgi:hypothetical protein